MASKKKTVLSPEVAASETVTPDPQEVTPDSLETTDPAPPAAIPPEGVTVSNIPFPSNLPNDFPSKNQHDSFEVPIYNLPHRPVYRAGMAPHPDEIQIGGHLPPDADPTPLTPEQWEQIRTLEDNFVYDPEKGQALRDLFANLPKTDAPDPRVEAMRLAFASELNDYLMEREYELIQDLQSTIPGVLTFFLKMGTQLAVRRESITGFVLREGHPESIVLDNGQTIDLATLQGSHAARAKENETPYRLWARENDPVQKLEALRQMIREGMESGPSEVWDVERFLDRQRAKKSEEIQMAKKAGLI